MKIAAAVVIDIVSRDQRGRIGDYRGYCMSEVFGRSTNGLT